MSPLAECSWQPSLGAAGWGAAVPAGAAANTAATMADDASAAIDARLILMKIIPFTPVRHSQRDVAPRLWLLAQSPVTGRQPAGQQSAGEGAASSWTGRADARRRSTPPRSHPRRCAFGRPSLFGPHPL